MDNITIDYIKSYNSSYPNCEKIRANIRIDNISKDDIDIIITILKTLKDTINT